MSKLSKNVKTFKKFQNFKKKNQNFKTNYKKFIQFQNLLKIKKKKNLGLGQSINDQVRIVMSRPH